jgi:hypothetical protein
MEVAAAIVLATLVGPFLIGWWIGHPAFAAMAWGALGLTVLIRQLTLDDGSSEGAPLAWIVVGSAVSAAAAAYGARVRERRRADRADRHR